MLTFAFYLFSRASFPEELREVKAYVAKADPALESCYQQHGQYPTTLDQLNLAVRPPSELRYIRLLDRDHKWVGTFTRRGDEIYVIWFSNAEYEGNGF